jgi:hypothetical protein
MTGTAPGLATSPHAGRSGFTIRVDAFAAGGLAHALGAPLLTTNWLVYF